MTITQNLGRILTDLEAGWTLSDLGLTNEDAIKEVDLSQPNPYERVRMNNCLPIEVMQPGTILRPHQQQGSYWSDRGRDTKNQSGQPNRGGRSPSHSPHRRDNKKGASRPDEGTSLGGWVGQWGPYKYTGPPKAGQNSG